MTSNVVAFEAPTSITLTLKETAKTLIVTRIETDYKLGVIQFFKHDQMIAEYQRRSVIGWAAEWQ